MNIAKELSIYGLDNKPEIGFPVVGK